MAVPSTYCEAKKHGYRQTQDGIVISFVLHPEEVPDDLALAALGTRYMIAFARIGDDEEPVPPQQKPTRPRKPFHTLPRSQQAGILCSDLTFYRWAADQIGNKSGLAMNSIKDARQFILNSCNVNSRRELDVSDDAGVLWDALRGQFEAATGRATEARG